MESKWKVGRLAPALLVCLAARPAIVAQAPSLEALVARAMTYVVAYERELGHVIAEEEYVQRVWPPASNVIPMAKPGGGGLAMPVAQPRTQVTMADVLMIRLANDPDRWVGFRDVFKVNDRMLRDRARRFEELFKTAPADAVEEWKRINEESARFNLGPKRTINVPTFALVYLRGRANERLRLTRRRDERVGGVAYPVVEYEERARPTVIIDENGRHVPARGRFWISPADGHIIRTELRAQGLQAGLQARITVEYARDPRLGMLVPVEMRERYDLARDVMVEGEARYSNFRRFETGGRIIGPD